MSRCTTHTRSGQEADWCGGGSGTDALYYSGIHDSTHMSHVITRMSHIMYEREACPVITHTITHERVISHTNESCHISQRTQAADW